jgi:hypothetical protein
VTCDNEDTPASERADSNLEQARQLLRIIIAIVAGAVAYGLWEHTTNIQYWISTAAFVALGLILYFGKIKR